MSDAVREALDRAVRIAGGETPLARMLGVRRQAVYAFMKVGRVTPTTALAIETVTGGEVKASQLRPDRFDHAA